MTLPAPLLALLVCPRCKGPLEHRDAEALLICHSCKLAYPIRDDIPIMLADEASPL
ncbi:MAG: Trm112 family protein [Gemmatimonadaceae bacterium]